MKWCWTTLTLSPWRAFHLQGSQVLFHTTPQLPNGIFHTLNILHALSRSEHQRLVDPGSGVTMATAAERIWMFLGWDFAAGHVGQSGAALLTSVPLWASCCGRGCSGPAQEYCGADLCVWIAHLNSLRSGRGGGSPSHAMPHVEVGQLNYTLRYSCFSLLALRGAEHWALLQALTL